MPYWGWIPTSALSGYDATDRQCALQLGPLSRLHKEKRARRYGEPFLFDRYERRRLKARPARNRSRGSRVFWH